MFRYIFETSHGFIAKNMMLYSIHTGSTAANNNGESHRGQTLLVLMAGCHTIFFFHPRSSDVLAGKHGTDARISIVLHEHSGTARGIKAFRIPSLYSPFSTNTGMPNKMTRTTHLRVPVFR